MDTFIKRINKSLERVFRYIISGAFLLIVGVAAYPEIYTTLVGMDKLILITITVTSGFIIYVFHRTFLSAFEAIFFYTEFSAVSLFWKGGKRRNIKPWARFIIERQQLKVKNKTLSDYLDLGWANAHSALICSEFLILFCCLHSPMSVIHEFWKFYCGATLIISVLSVLQIIRMYNVEKFILEKFVEDSKS